MDGAEGLLHGITWRRTVNQKLTMWKIFEDFITCAITEALRPYGGRCQPQDKNHHLDHAHRVQPEPDLVYYHLDQTGREIPRAVIDAKSKRLSGTGPNADIYQLLAYCTALGLPTAIRIRRRN